MHKATQVCYFQEFLRKIFGYILLTDTYANKNQLCAIYFRTSVNIQFLFIIFRTRPLRNTRLTSYSSARIDDVTTAFTRGHLLLTLRMTLAPHSESFWNFANDNLNSFNRWRYNRPYQHQSFVSYNITAMKSCDKTHTRTVILEFFWRWNTLLYISSR